MERGNRDDGERRNTCENGRIDRNEVHRNVDVAAQLCLLRTKADLR